MKFTDLFYRTLSSGAAALFLTTAPYYGALAQSSEPTVRISAPINVIGEAFRQGTDELLYRELHHYELSDTGELEHQVTYTQPNGDPWANKTIFYNGRITAPSFELVDTLNSESLNVSVADDTLTIAHTKNQQVQKQQLDAQLPLVVDAGFDPFVRQQWQSLSAGESETFYFLLPRREKLVQLKLSPKSCRDADSAQHFCLSLDINNWLLRMLVDSIELTYSRADQRLTRYQGVSNLSFPEQEDTPQVDIRYRPANTPDASR